MYSSTGNNAYLWRDYMKFFKAEIKLNHDFVASSRINITARRYIGKHTRWYAELNSGFHSRMPIDSVQGNLKQIKEFIAKWQDSHKEKNQYGFDKKETISNLISKHNLASVGGDLFSGEKCVFNKPRGGLKSRLKATWLFFKDLEGK